MFQTSVVVKIKTLFYIQYFFLQNLAVYEIMWKSNVQPDRPEMTVWHMRIVCWISDSTKAHSEYVIRMASRK